MHFQNFRKNRRPGGQHDIVMKILRTFKACPAVNDFFYLIKIFNDGMHRFPDVF